MLRPLKEEDEEEKEECVAITKAERSKTKAKADSEATCATIQISGFNPPATPIGHTNRPHQSATPIADSSAR